MTKWSCYFLTVPKPRHFPRNICDIPSGKNEGAGNEQALLEKSVIVPPFSVAKVLLTGTKQAWG
jgi:hypothetical protein